MKKTIVSLLFIPIFLATACSSNETNQSATSTQTTEQSTNTTTTQYSSQTESSSEQENLINPHALDEIIGVWSNEQNQSFAITNQAYISGDKIYHLTNFDKQEIDGQTQYVFSWDTDAFIEEYGEPEPFNPQPFIYKYNAQEDTLQNSVTFKRSHDSEQITYVKDQLAGHEPINLEQLLEVDDYHLMAYWFKATTLTDDLSEQLKILYHDLAMNYPELDLLVNQEYEEYLTLAKEIEAQSDYTFSDLNTALPKDIYKWYVNLTKEKTDNPIPKLLPKIEQARNAYFERKSQSERPYLETDKAKISEQLNKHIREKIKQEYPNDIPKKHIVYEMARDGKTITIDIFENTEQKMQHQLRLIYSEENDTLARKE
ncbi:hypothetical protein [Candidatus Enterococcus willemsii]|uniref:DUF4767 domain-containing protein n=1 Tax=Candidatus Enterococcus willemsii TaxID=1857215 RepID=A0ABQ6YVR8_9ENTE|nr:hypothetical protein [Enterococcus sp. CU12B]KAF1301434.1 hypothetical protein BAU17_05780 [Enterococcus sp. CU12B]